MLVREKIDKHCPYCGDQVERLVDYYGSHNEHFMIHEMCPNCNMEYDPHVPYDPWRPLLNDFVKEYIRNNYHEDIDDIYEDGLYNRVFEEMKDKVRRIIMEEN